MDQDKRMSFIVVSYVPLLVGEAGATLDLGDIDNVVKHVDSLPNGSAVGCAWFMGPGGVPFPVLVMPDAKAIANHLTAWAEGNPVESIEPQVRIGCISHECSVSYSAYRLSV